jgi:predicted FMN-binding regulatory protein PaiB
VFVPSHFDFSHLRGLEMTVEPIGGPLKLSQNRHVGEMMR